MTDESVLADSDALVALVIEKDSNHRKAEKIKQELKDQKVNLLVINLVLQESVTVLSLIANQVRAIEFYGMVIRELPTIIFIDEDLEKKAYEVFVQQTKKGTSFVDCANMAVMKQLGIETIFSFDKIYKRNGFKRAGIN